MKIEFKPTWKQIWYLVFIVIPALIVYDEYFSKKSFMTIDISTYKPLMSAFAVAIVLTGIVLFYLSLMNRLDKISNYVESNNRQLWDRVSTIFYLMRIREDKETFYSLTEAEKIETEKSMLRNTLGRDLKHLTENDINQIINEIYGQF